jgi:hypothetical protein
MTHLDELVSFILSDKLKEIRNFDCYDELVAEAQKLQQEQVKNIAYEPVLAVVTLENDNPVMKFPDCSVGDAVLLLAKVAKHSSRERLIFSSIENNIPHV